MQNSVASFLLILACSVFFSLPVKAETILEKIVRTGELTAGARTDSSPFGYIGETGDLQGYSVDLLFLIHRKLEEKLGKRIVFKLLTVTVNNRFREVKQGRMDIVCEATTITSERMAKVDFSTPFFVTGSQFLIKKLDAKDFDVNGSLNGQAIAYIPSTTAFDDIPPLYPGVRWVEVRSRKEGLAMLKKGEVKSIVSDGILLIGELVKNGDDPRQFSLTPVHPSRQKSMAAFCPRMTTTGRRSLIPRSPLLKTKNSGTSGLI